MKENFSEITYINMNSQSFDFLNVEPEIYSISDLKEKYLSQYHEKHANGSIQIIH